MSTNRKSTLWTDLKEITQSLFYEKQRTCLLCNAPINNAKGICPICEQSYFHPELGRCPHCGKLIPQNRIQCRDCEEGRGPKGLDQVSSWGHYTGAWRDFIQTVKFKSQPYLLKKISRPLADWAIQTLPPPHLLVPVPMHPERLAERGFNQTAAIASMLHWELGIPTMEALKRTSFIVPQVGLTRNERLHNLKGVFCVSKPQDGDSISGRRIWIIDDVITTGATLEACALALREAGAEKIYCVTLAAGIEKSTIQFNQSMV